MKKFTFDVSKVKLGEIENLFTGNVTMNIPNIRERKDFLKDGNIAKSINTDDISSDDLDSGFDLFERASRNILEVDITHESLNGERITNPDDLTCYEEGFILFQELCKYVINGIPLGKN